jgi:[ribosomal protein S5]-alanine N-acetyltransferase
MTIIYTPRMRLISLTQDQLRECLLAGPDLHVLLGVPLAEGVVSNPAMRAMRVKIDKMMVTLPEDHLWLTYWLLVERSSHVGIGMAGFKGVPGKDGKTEIGYGLAPLYQRQGYMTEAVRALAKWALEQPVCNVVTAETLAENIPSHRVLEKTGFHVVRKTQAELFWEIEKTSLQGK